MKTSESPKTPHPIPGFSTPPAQERGLVLAASEGHMLVIFDLGLTGA